MYLLNIIKITKKDFKKKSCVKYWSLPEELKEKNPWQYGHERYKNLCKDENQNLVE